jgi:hypothetical protein
MLTAEHELIIDALVEQRLVTEAIIEVLGIPQEKVAEAYLKVSQAENVAAIRLKVLKDYEANAVLRELPVGSLR